MIPKPHRDARREPQGERHHSLGIRAAMRVPVEVRLYDRLFNVENPLADKERDFLEFINPDSLQVIEQAWVEPAALEPGAPPMRQFERNGYFIRDSVDSSVNMPVFNRTVTLRDTWAKLRGG